MTNLEEQIREILKKTYSGSNHIGEIYNNEATQAILSLFAKRDKELLEGIEGMRKREEDEKPIWNEDGTQTLWYQGYNQALTDIAKLIKR